MTRVSRQFVPVYGPHTPSSRVPDFKLPYADAKALVVHGEAQFIRHATAIRLMTLDLPKFRDASCQMPASVMFAFVAAVLALRKRGSSPRIVRMVEAWNPKRSEVMVGYKRGEINVPACLIRADVPEYSFNL